MGLVPGPGAVGRVAADRVDELAQAHPHVGLQLGLGLQLVVGVALDTVRAALDCAGVIGVVVVTDDEEVRAAVEQGEPGSSVKRISVVAKTLSNAIASARRERSVH